MEPGRPRGAGQSLPDHARPCPRGHRQGLGRLRRRAPARGGAEADQAESADDPDSRARFLLEAEVTGRLEHPGIVPVYGLGFDDQGRPLLRDAVRPRHHLRGGDRHLPRRPTPAGRPRPAGADAGAAAAARPVRDVCQTMAYAHSRGVLHRDLKPANVLLGPVQRDAGRRLGPGQGAGGPGGRRRRSRRCRDGGRRRPTEKRPAAAAGPPRDACRPLGYSSSTDTVAGAAFGTPAYMSPEQAEGRLDQLGPASDVYSLGAMLYTLLCRPAAVRVRLVRRHRAAGPGPDRRVPAAAAGQPAGPPAAGGGLPEGDGQPRRRTGTPRAEALAGEIERWLADEPVAAYREPRWARLARWGRRHRPLVAGAAALLADRRGRAVRGDRPARPRAARDRGPAAGGRPQSGRSPRSCRTRPKQRPRSLRRRDAVSRVNLAYREYLDDNVALADELLDGCPSTSATGSGPTSSGWATPSWRAS